MIQINMQHYKVIYGVGYERVAGQRQTSEKGEIIFHWGKSFATKMSDLPISYRVEREFSTNGSLTVKLQIV